jgi:toxin FitB
VIVLDTNVLSELMRLNPFHLVNSWIEKHAGPQLAVTVVTEAEILYGLELMPAGKRRNELLTAAETLFIRIFRGRTLPFDSEAARLYAKIASARRANGKPMSVPDAQIAAIVLAHRAVLATRNIMDFEGCGIQLVNPWEEKV